MMAIYQNNLKIYHWNIQGIRDDTSEVLKTDDPEVASELVKNDIIILSESHCDTDCDINLKDRKSVV